MGLPKPESDDGGTLSPFLKASNIGKKLGASAVLVFQGGSRLVDGNFGEQLVVPVKVGKKDYDFGMQLTSVNYRLLYERFGPNDKKWKGAVKVTLKMSASKRLYVAVVKE